MHAQVRQRMHTAVEALQGLDPTNAAEPLDSTTLQPAHADDLDDDDNTCIICLDQPASAVFNPCSHRVTCAACAQLVIDARQPCPLCRGSLVSIKQC